MFMRFHGGAVGHKTTHEETRCLLDDHDKLDKVPFELESEQDLPVRYEENSKRGDVEMGSPGAADDSGIEDDGSDDEDDGNEGSEREESDDGNESNGTDSSEDMVIDPELMDEMDKFGYLGLDQVEEEEELGDGDLADDVFGAEDGENTMGWDEVETEPAHAYLWNHC